MQLQNRYVPWLGSFPFRFRSHSPYNLKTTIDKKCFERVSKLTSKIIHDTSENGVASLSDCHIFQRKHKIRLECWYWRWKRGKYCKQSEITTQNKSNGFIVAVFIVASSLLHTKYDVVSYMNLRRFPTFCLSPFLFAFLHIKNSKVKIK